MRPDVTPEAYHCAILSDGELAQLRRIRKVVRLGRVAAINRAEIVLDRGTILTSRTPDHPAVSPDVSADVQRGDVKNHICAPIAPPTVPLDWLRMIHTELAARC